MKKTHGLNDFNLMEDGCPYCMELFDSLAVLRDHIKVKHETDCQFSCDVSV